MTSFRGYKAKGGAVGISSGRGKLCLQSLPEMVTYGSRENTAHVLSLKAPGQIKAWKHAVPWRAEAELRAAHRDPRGYTWQPDSPGGCEESAHFSISSFPPEPCLVRPTPLPHSMCFKGRPYPRSSGWNLISLTSQHKTGHMGSRGGLMTQADLTQ